MALMIRDGSVLVDNIIISPLEKEFYQLLADDYTIIAAAEAVFTSKRTCEDRMYRLRNHLNIKTTNGLIAYLIRKKVIR